MTLRTTLLSCILCFATSAVAATQPNVVIILADDLGYADVGFNGCKDIPTPHIDRIAKEGARCSSGYVSYSVCGPSRAGLITGRYQDRFGFGRNPTINPADENSGLPLSETNLAEALSSVGYRTMAVGKWHLGVRPEYRPFKRGFDEFFGFLSGGHDYFPENLTLQDLSEVTEPWAWYRTKLLRGDERVQTDEYLTDELSHEAAAFVRRCDQNPFFLYLAYNAPHTPLQATQEYLDRFDHIEDEKRKTYAAMISSMDDGVGEVLAALDETGVADRTMIYFLSDNGGAIKYGCYDNTPLRDGKGSLFEGGVRVPFAIRWPDKIPAGIDYDQPVSALDIFATAVSAAGYAPAPERPLDGVDLAPHLSGDDPSAPHDVLFWRSFDKGEAAVRHGAQKLVDSRKHSGPKLFDLATDVGEKHDLIEEQPDAAEALRRRFEAWDSELIPPVFSGLGSWNPRKEPADPDLSY